MPIIEPYKEQLKLPSCQTSIWIKQVLEKKIKNPVKIDQPMREAGNKLSCEHVVDAMRMELYTVQVDKSKNYKGTKALYCLECFLRFEHQDYALVVGQENYASFLYGEKKYPTVPFKEEVRIYIYILFKK